MIIVFKLILMLKILQINYGKFLIHFFPKSVHFKVEWEVYLIFNEKKNLK